MILILSSPTSLAARVYPTLARELTRNDTPEHSRNIRLWAPASWPTSLEPTGRFGAHSAPVAVIEFVDRDVAAKGLDSGPVVAKEPVAEAVAA